MNKWILGIVVLALGVIVGWNLFTERTPVPSAESTTQTTGETSTITPALATTSGATGTLSATGSADTTKGGIAERVMVVYGPTGFVPSPITVKVGTTVVFTNALTTGMWVASDPHPIHSLLPGFDELKSVTKDGIYEFTFTKVGTWKYHNHMNPTDGGTVIVTN